MKSVRYYEEEEEDAVVEEAEAAAAQSSKNYLYLYLYPIHLPDLSVLYNSTDFARLLNIIDLTCLSLSSNS